MFVVVIAIVVFANSDTREHKYLDTFVNGFPVIVAAGILFIPKNLVTHIYI